MASASLSAPAHAEPTVDNNLGTWVDLYDDSNGIAPAATSVGGNPGQSGIFRDPFAKAVGLDTGQSSGNWFSSEIAPASFSGWKALYLDYLAGWRERGGRLFVHFSSTSRFTKWGSWGFAEWYDEKDAAKLAALRAFAAANPRWWRD